MRALIFCAIAVAVLALVGWITFSTTSDSASVNLKTDKIKSDTEQMVESGQEMLDESGNVVEERTETPDATVDDDSPDDVNDTTNTLQDSGQTQVEQGSADQVPANARD